MKILITHNKYYNKCGTEGKMIVHSEYYPTSRGLKRVITNTVNAMKKLHGIDSVYVEYWTESNWFGNGEPSTIIIR